MTVLNNFEVKASIFNLYKYDMLELKFGLHTLPGDLNV